MPAIPAPIIQLPAPWTVRLLRLLIVVTTAVASSGLLLHRARADSVEIVDPRAMRLAFARAWTTDPNQTWLRLVNPGADPANVRVTLYPDGGSPLPSQLLLAPGAASDLSLNDLAPDSALAVLIESDRPVAADRAGFHGSRTFATAALTSS